jgi:hypothetical protein
MAKVQQVQKHTSKQYKTAFFNIFQKTYIEFRKDKINNLYQINPEFCNRCCP